MNAEKYTFSQLARRYCERQDSTPDNLLQVLRGQIPRFNPDGWFLLEAQLMDSSWMGSLVILPYGGQATHKTIPDYPVSPRGLASDTSVAVAYLPVADLPESLPDDLRDWQPPKPTVSTFPKRKRKARK